MLDGFILGKYMKTMEVKTILFIIAFKLGIDDQIFDEKLTCKLLTWKVLLEIAKNWQSCA